MKTIMVGTDFTPAGNDAVRYAAEMAFQYKAKLIIVHATQLMLTSHSLIDLAYILEEVEASDRKRMDTLSQRLAQKYNNQIGITTSVMIGFIKDVLTKKTHEFHPDLLVLGIPQVDFMSKKIFGSTSFQVVKSLSIPILVVPEKCKFKSLKKILYTYDGQNIKSKASAAFINNILQQSQAEFHVLHVKDDLYPETNLVKWNKTRLPFSITESNFHELYAIPGQTAMLLSEWAKKLKAEWIITVPRAHNFFWALFHESISKKLTYKSNLPVLIFNA